MYYINLLKKLDPSLNTEAASEVEEWMRDFIYPTLDHLPMSAFKKAIKDWKEY